MQCVLYRFKQYPFACITGCRLGLYLRAAISRFDSEARSAFAAGFASDTPTLGTRFVAKAHKAVT
jgi:hypothetical protein